MVSQQWRWERFPCISVFKPYIRFESTHLLIYLGILFNSLRENSLPKAIPIHIVLHSELAYELIIGDLRLLLG